MEKEKYSDPVIVIQVPLATIMWLPEIDTY